MAQTRPANEHVSVRGFGPRFTDLPKGKDRVMKGRGEGEVGRGGDNSRENKKMII